MAKKPFASTKLEGSKNIGEGKIRLPGSLSHTVKEHDFVKVILGEKSGYFKALETNDNADINFALIPEGELGIADLEQSDTEAGIYNISPSHARLVRIWRNPSNRFSMFAFVTVLVSFLLSPKVLLLAGSVITFAGESPPVLDDANKATIEGVNLLLKAIAGLLAFIGAIWVKD